MRRLIYDEKKSFKGKRVNEKKRKFLKKDGENKFLGRGILK